MSTLPSVPLTIEGSAVLHQLFRIRWSEWRGLAEEDRKRIAADASAKLSAMEEAGSAVFSMFGHRGDLMVLHFREDFEQLNQAQLALTQMELYGYLEQAGSYLSVVELGLYESSVKLFRAMSGRGVKPQSAEWEAEVEETLGRQRQAMRTRLYPAIPDGRYVCFYPMSRRRGEQKNWYTLPIEERQQQMDQHGQVGRRYAGKVKQIISGSIGLDDWEWAVDLFAEQPVEFKKLIYEMRFDEVSGVYSEFGSFFVGLRCRGTEIGELLEGRTPKGLPRG